MRMRKNEDGKMRNTDIGNKDGEYRQRKKDGEYRQRNTDRGIQIEEYR